MLIICTMAADLIRSRDEQAELLLERMALGDVSAMGELYELISKDVYAYAYSKTANRADAEDAAHDTFLQIWKSAPSYKPQGKPLAWIFTIEMNLLRVQFSRASRLVFLDETIQDKASDDNFTDEVINKEFLGQILLSLGEEEREIISLHIVSGLKHREIAKLLGKPLSTVLSKYNRAIKKLQIEAKKGANL